MATSRKLVILKARQLGISWLCLSYALWLMLFQAPATILLFSLREEESKELLWRLRGMYDRLPPHLRARSVTHSNETALDLVERVAGAGIFDAVGAVVYGDAGAGG